MSEDEYELYFRRSIMGMSDSTLLSPTAYQALQAGLDSARQDIASERLLHPWDDFTKYAVEKDEDSSFQEGIDSELDTWYNFKRHNKEAE